MPKWELNCPRTFAFYQHGSSQGPVDMDSFYQHGSPQGPLILNHITYNVFLADRVDSISAW